MHLHVVVGPPVITKVTRHPATESIPFPDGALFEVAAIAGLFGVTRKTVYNLISRERKCLDRPMYRKGHRARLHRLLTEKDVTYLRQFFTLRVKR